MKSRGGMYRRMIDAAKRLLGKPVVHYYPDPIPRRPVKNRGVGRYRNKADRKRASHKGIPCVPGTFSYHDKLVSHFGHKRALVYRRLIQDGKLELLPTEQEFADAPPWAFLAAQKGE